MTLRDILIFTLIGLLIRALSRREGARAWLLYLASLLAIYWLQPLSPVRNLDFWFPTATLGLAALELGVNHPARPAQLARECPGLWRAGGGRAAAGADPLPGR